MGVLLLRKQSTTGFSAEEEMSQRLSDNGAVTPTASMTSPSSGSRPHHHGGKYADGRLLASAFLSGGTNVTIDSGHRLEEAGHDHHRPYYISSDGGQSARNLSQSMGMEPPKRAAGVRCGAYELLPVGESGFGDLASEVDSLSWPRFRSSAAKWVDGMAFQAVVAMIILANAIVIGCETDDTENASYWDNLESGLLLMFTVELVLRVAFVQTFFTYSHADFVWNMFDLFLVSVGLIDLVMSTFFYKSEVVELTESNSSIVTSIFRIFRIARLLRIIRLVRFLKQLYILSYGFLLAAEAVFWVSILMLATLYTCAIVLVRSVGRPTDSDPQASAEFWQNHYGSVGKTMLTLFQLMVQPNLWEYREILFEHPFFSAFMVAFIIFGSFGMIALLTGVISEAMFQKNQVKLEEERTDREITRSALLDGCKLLFDEICGGTEEITRQQVREMFPRIRELFDDMGVRYTMHELEDMVGLMDTDGSGSVNKSEFCRCLLHIAENSEDLRPMLMMELHYDSMSFLRARLNEFKAHLDDSLQEQRSSRQAMEGSVTTLLRQLEQASSLASQRQAALDARMTSMEQEVREVRAAVKSLANSVRDAEGTRAPDPER